MVTIEREDSEYGPPYEKCCVCSIPTPFWYVENDVPLCGMCAANMEEKDVPTKEEYWENCTKNK